MAEDRIQWQRPTPAPSGQDGHPSSDPQGVDDDEFSLQPPSGERPGAKPRRSGPRLIVLCAALVAALVVAWLLVDRSTTSSAPVTEGRSSSVGATEAATTTSTSTLSPTSVVTKTSIQNAQQSAHADLQALAATDTKSLSLDGHWVAMLAGKTSGLVDPLDKPPDGGRAWSWTTIKQQHESLRKDPRFTGSIRLVLSTSFGDAVTYHGKPLFVTIYDGSFSGAADVRSWCSRTFASLDARHRADVCAPARMSRPR